MSRSKATKRRKVWVNCYEGGGTSNVAHPTRTSAVTSIGSDGLPICLIERLPGDVVLSREQADLICRRLNDLYDVTVQDKHEIRALLRGRR